MYKAVYTKTVTQECFEKEGVLESFAKLIGNKTGARVSFLVTFPATFLIKNSVKSVEYFKTLFS